LGREISTTVPLAGPNLGQCGARFLAIMAVHGRPRQLPVQIQHTAALTGGREVTIKQTTVTRRDRHFDPAINTDCGAR
jgi:hypothetical protein